MVRFTAPSVVELWSKRRLPFEPKGWLKTMRGQLRDALRQIQFTNNTFLQSTYVSLDTGSFDVENVLLYNVGVASFRHLCRNGLSFERKVRTVPDCPTSLNDMSMHYHRYELVPPSPVDDISHGVRVAKWRDLHCPPLTQDTKPHVLWSLLRRHRVVTATRPFMGRFGLELELFVPHETSVHIAAIVKPLVDGVVCAFHSHDGSDLPIVSSRLSSVTGYPVQEIQSLLMAPDMAKLGQIKLVHPRSRGVQWNPADHRCEKAQVKVSYGTQCQWTLNGRICALEPSLQTTCMQTLP